jgi:HlyD family secretion protein
LALAIAAAWLALRPCPVPLEARFRTALVSEGDVVREVRATGHVEAVTTVQVGAEISGRLASVKVDFNDHVRAGQVMARFDRALLAAQLAQARATLSAAQAALSQADVDAQHALNNLARSEELYHQHVAPDIDYENAIVASRGAQHRFLAAQAQVAAQQAAYDLARTTMSHAEIRSPIDGIVVTRNVDPGQTVASVFMTPVLFTVAADLSKMRVLAAVDEADIGEVAPGQSASFTVNAWPDRTFVGAVTEVRNSPAVVQDVVTYQAVIEVANPDLALKPGMTASVRIRTASARHTLRVPSAALHFSPPDQPEYGIPGLWILRDRALRRVEVRAGISDGQVTAIGGGPPAGTAVLLELTPQGRKSALRRTAAARGDRSRSRQRPGSPPRR